MKGFFLLYNMLTFLNRFKPASLIQKNKMSWWPLDRKCRSSTSAAASWRLMILGSAFDQSIILRPSPERMVFMRLSECGWREQSGRTSFRSVTIPLSFNPLWMTWYTGDSSSSVAMTLEYLQGSFFVLVCFCFFFCCLLFCFVLFF